MENNRRHPSWRRVGTKMVKGALPNGSIVCLSHWTCYAFFKVDACRLARCTVQIVKQEGFELVQLIGVNQHRFVGDPPRHKLAAGRFRQASVVSVKVNCRN